MITLIGFHCAWSPHGSSTKHSPLLQPNKNASKFESNYILEVFYVMSLTWFKIICKSCCWNCILNLRPMAIQFSWGASVRRYVQVCVINLAPSNDQILENMKEAKSIWTLVSYDYIYVKVRNICILILSCGILVTIGHFLFWVQ